MQEELLCQDCGKPGFECLDPYAQEINDVEIECVLCEECYHEYCMDI